MTAPAKNYIRLPFVIDEIILGTGSPPSPSTRTPIENAEIHATLISGQIGDAAIYKDVAGTELESAPKSNAAGEFPFYIAEGSYKFTITSGSKTKEIYWDAVSHHQSDMPPGTIMYYVGSAAPTGFLKCDGQEYTETAYPSLYAAMPAALKKPSNKFQVPSITAPSGTCAVIKY